MRFQRVDGRLHPGRDRIHVPQEPIHELTGFVRVGCDFAAAVYIGRQSHIAQFRQLPGTPFQVFGPAPPFAEHHHARRPSLGVGIVGQIALQSGIAGVVVNDLGMNGHSWTPLFLSGGCLSWCGAGW